MSVGRWVVGCGCRVSDIGSWCSGVGYAKGRRECKGRGNDGRTVGSVTGNTFIYILQTRLEATSLHLHPPLRFLSHISKSYIASPTPPLSPPFIPILILTIPHSPSRATGSFLFGYDSGIIGSVISDAYDQFRSYYNDPTPAVIGAIVSLFAAGAVFGALFAGACCVLRV